MVCVFNSGLWQPNACDSETDYDDEQAFRAHESCIPSEYIFPLCCIIITYEILLGVFGLSMDFRSLQKSILLQVDILQIFQQMLYISETWR